MIGLYLYGFGSAKTFFDRKVQEDSKRTIDRFMHSTPSNFVIRTLQNMIIWETFTFHLHRFYKLLKIL